MTAIWQIDNFGLGKGEAVLYEAVNSYLGIWRWPTICGTWAAITGLAAPWILCWCRRCAPESAPTPLGDSVDPEAEEGLVFGRAESNVGRIMVQTVPSWDSRQRERRDDIGGRIGHEDLTSTSSMSGSFRSCLVFCSCCWSSWLSAVAWDEPSWSSVEGRVDFASQSPLSLTSGSIDLAEALSNRLLSVSTSTTKHSNNLFCSVARFWRSQNPKSATKKSQKKPQ